VVSGRPARLSADARSCIGAGRCVDVAPELFDSGEDGLVVVLRQPDEPQLRAAAEEAAALCPVMAIALRAERVLTPGDQSGR
jgi:ferredoxin